jgi:hypothetical protein
LQQIPRLDAATGSAGALTSCDRFDPSTCPRGQVCDEVVEAAPGSADLMIYAGCVEVDGLRGPGDPCTPWTDRYTAVEAEVYYDPCGDGLVCADDPVVRGSTSCQPVCQTGAFGDAPVGCESDSAFCLSVGAFREVCRESDACDVVAQRGCRTGEACYLRVNDTRQGFLSLCLAAPLAADAVADHKSCQAVNDCRAGSSCLGPVHLAADQWQLSDYACRPLCSNDSGQDAGADDAGSGAECSGSAACVPFSDSALSLAQLPEAPYGLCER